MKHAHKSIARAVWVVLQLWEPSARSWNLRHPSWVRSGLGFISALNTKYIIYFFHCHFPLQTNRFLRYIFCFPGVFVSREKQGMNRGSIMARNLEHSIYYYQLHTLEGPSFAGNKRRNEIKPIVFLKIFFKWRKDKRIDFLPKSTSLCGPTLGPYRKSAVDIDFHRQVLKLTNGNVIVPNGKRNEKTRNRSVETNQIGLREVIFSFLHRKEGCPPIKLHLWAPEFLSIINWSDLISTSNRLPRVKRSHLKIPKDLMMLIT
jgi:hypothetical protein